MSMKKDFLMPIIVLLFICFFVSGALAVVNSITRPVIEYEAAYRAAEEKKVIMPQADNFEQLHIEGLPRTITEVYRATNNIGYIFSVSVRGYGRDDMKLLCGVDMNGRIIRAAVLEHTETISFFNRVFNEQHRDQYWGRNKNEIEDIAAISGATITSTALKNAMRDSLTAFEIVTGQGVR